jgi:hypothetical protein
MSLREAAQQALEAMACMRDMVAHPDNLQFIDNAITALRTALAEPEQKPVAWANKDDLGKFDMRVRTNCDHYHTVPLYTTPPAAPVQEPVALETVYETIIHWDEGGGKRSRRELARRIVALYTHPPQRKPLTDEEIDALPLPPSGTATVRDIVRLIERAHGIGGEQ